MLKKFHSILFYAGNLNKTLEFYKQLGFDAELSEGTVRAKLGDFRLAFVDENKAFFKKDAGAQPKGSGVFTYVEVDDIDAYFNLLKEKGIKTLSQPRDWPWGKREFAVKDPDGYKLIFYSPTKS